MEAFFTTIIVVLLSIAASQATNIEDGSVSHGYSSALSYWHQKLPTTPIPDFLLGMVSCEEREDFLSLRNIQDNRESLSVGKPPRKLGKNIPMDGSSLRQPMPNLIIYTVYNSSQDEVGTHSLRERMPNLIIYTYHNSPKSEVGTHSLRQPSYPASKDQGQILIDPPAMFFLEKDLRIGTQVIMNLSYMRSQGIYFLPRSKADEIPFSVEKLSISLEKLQIPSESGMAAAMEEALQECESPAMKGESKYCATSLESVIDYSTSRLGTNGLNVFVTNLPKNSTSGKLHYSITSFPFQSKTGSRLINCHRLTYAYAVYYCHELNDIRMFQISLKGEVEDGEASTAKVVTICHYDTSAWDPDHVSFKLLNVKPGSEAICHFMPEDHIVFSTNQTS